jgi:hypothetical protein
MYQRALDEKMFKDFKEGGVLHDLLERVCKDDTLDLEFRGECAANIYYRGGSLFEIWQSGTSYTLQIHANYLAAYETPDGRKLDCRPSILAATADIPYYKEAMDFHLAKPGNRNYEREFQQLVVRENNRHGAISHASDYYIVDIEYAYNDNVLDKKTQARFDMIAVKWLSKSNERQNPSAPTLAIIEMKYGDGALGGNAGLKKHLEDFGTLVKNGELDDFCADYSNVFNQKCALGLIPGKEGARIKITQQDIELIFLIANHDPDKTGLAKIVAEIADVTMEYPYPIRFACASMMGYCLYADQMKSLEEMQEFLNKKA